MNTIICDIIFFFGLTLLALNVFLFVFLKNKAPQLKIVTAYLTVSLIEGLVCYKIYFLIPEANFLVSHFYFGLHLLFISFFYFQLFKDRNLKKAILLFTVLILVGFTLYYIINPASFMYFNLLETTIVCSFLATLGLVYLYKTLGETKKYFYFSIGLALYFLCTCIIYLTGNIVIVFNKDPYLDQWIFKDLFFIVFQVLIFIEYRNLKATHD